MTLKEIGGMIKFVTSAVLAKTAGADGVEVHAPMVIFKSILSPATNKRTDAYGGSLRIVPRLSTNYWCIRQYCGLSSVLGVSAARIHRRWSAIR